MVNWNDPDEARAEAERLLRSTAAILTRTPIAANCDMCGACILEQESWSLADESGGFPAWYCDACFPEERKLLYLMSEL